MFFFHIRISIFGRDENLPDSRPDSPVVLSQDTPAVAVREPIFTGNKIYDVCSSEQLADQQNCYGYVAGVADVMQYDAVNRYRACVPAGTTPAQLREIAIKFLMEHPIELRHYTASALVATALGEAFPCPTN